MRQSMLGGLTAPDFLEAAHEWRPFRENLGTFLLVVDAGASFFIKLGHQLAEKLAKCERPCTYRHGMDFNSTSQASTLF